VDALFRGQYASGKSGDALANGYGEDYAMYCGKLDRVSGCSAMIWIRSWVRDEDQYFQRRHLEDEYLPVVKRFITHNAFAPLYLKTLRELAEGLFAPENLNPLLDNVLGDWVGPKEVERMKAFNANQVAYVLSLIPGKFEVTSTFEITKGYPTVTRSDVVFSGKADAVRTGSVLVNGLPAQYTAWKGEWSIALDLHPGVNLLVTQAYDSEGREIAYNESYILYETGALPNEINLATLETDMTLTAADGPWQINSDLMIGKGVTLQIEPGTAVYFGPNVRVSMGRDARILAEGTREKPIVFSGIPGGQRWRYILLNHVGVTDAVGNPRTVSPMCMSKITPLSFFMLFTGVFTSITDLRHRGRDLSQYGRLLAHGQQLRFRARTVRFNWCAR
jgi:hypothetical protein